MESVLLSGDALDLKIDLHGAELRSIKSKEGREYLWQADPAFWGRSSPVLFPFVGSCNGKEYRFEGRSYPMPQHGFARDMDFTPASCSENEAWFVLESSEETLAKYPFPFRLSIGYRLEGRRITVLWKVENPGDRELYFSIGAHPAFCCPPVSEQKRSDCSMVLRAPDGQPLSRFTNTLLGTRGLVDGRHEVCSVQDGVLPLSETLFDNDALILENRQAGSVALADGSGQEYLRVEFAAPLVGLWSPPKKNAPFVCIEPWYGRCDSENFTGSLQEREWGNVLAAGETFQTQYTICIL